VIIEIPENYRILSLKEAEAFEIKVAQQYLEIDPRIDCPNSLIGYILKEKK
jgi:hypothetical protein